MGLLPQLRLRNVHTPLSYSLRRAPGPANHGGPGVRLSTPFTKENRPSARKPEPKDGRRSAKSSVGQESASGNTRPEVRKKDGLPIGFLTERQKGEYGNGSKNGTKESKFHSTRCSWLGHAYHRTNGVFHVPRNTYPPVIGHGHAPPSIWVGCIIAPHSLPVKTDYVMYIISTSNTPFPVYKR